jgi:cytidylate kinase
MAVITINGPLGAGAVSIGQMVAQSLEINFYDRLVFTQAARLVGSPVGALIAKEQRVDRFRDRLGRFLQTMLERSAMSGVSGEPYFGRGIENLPPETFMEMMGEGNTANKPVDDKTFLEATEKVVGDIYESGNAVIIGRGANAILADRPGTFHVGLIAPLEVRVQTLMARENYTREEAENYGAELEQAHEHFFRRFFNYNPNDPTHYHVMLNMGRMEPKTAAEFIVNASSNIVSGSAAATAT